MSEFVRDALPSHEMIEATPLPSDVLDEDAQLNFDFQKKSKRFMGAASVFGGLSFLLPPKADLALNTIPTQLPETATSNYAEPKQFVVLEDSVKQDTLEAATKEVQRVADTGASGLEFTAQWVTGQKAPSEKDMTRFKNAVEAANNLGLEVTIKAYPCSHIDPECKDNSPPLSGLERGKFTNWIANLEYNLPTVKKYIIGNEVNDWSFWWPQRYPNGTPASAENYLKLLASSYDVLKKNAPKIGDGSEAIVYGLALNSEGTVPVKSFLKNFRKAYLISIKKGRKKPIVDGVAHHPYPPDSSQMPNKKYTDGRMGMSEYSELVNDLEETFVGTPQAKVNWVIIYDEYGIETRIPKNKNHLYHGKEQTSTRPVTEAEQAKNIREALGMAACQQRVVTFTNFLDKDEKNKARWQSALHYADGKPKASLEMLKPAVEKFEAGGEECKP